MTNITHFFIKKKEKMRYMRFLLKAITICYRKKKDLVIKTITNKINWSIFD